MPGPVSDSFDPEWGIGHNRDMIIEELQSIYDRISEILNGKKPIYILTLIHEILPDQINAELSEKEWRLIRFSLERAMESL